MATLSTQRRALIKNIYYKIRACEGGELEFYITKEGDFYVRYIPQIPIGYWCEDCLKRMTCITKLLNRWSEKRNFIEEY